MEITGIKKTTAFRAGSRNHSGVPRTSIPGQAIRKLKAADRKAGDTPEGCSPPANSHTTPSP